MDLLRITKLCKTDIRRFLVVLLICLISQTKPTVGYLKRKIKGTGGVYCPGPVLKQPEAASATQCASECSSDAQCVSYSQRAGSQCLLHADFCASAYLSAEPGSLYAGMF